jgi:transposase
MEGMAYQRYFLQRLDVQQRRYELLRTVFVDGQSLQDAAQRFDVSYGTVRNWVSEFRQLLDAGQRPPFLQSRLMVDR